jgi:hypothetical protein
MLPEGHRFACGLASVGSRMDVSGLACVVVGLRTVTNRASHRTRQAPIELRSTEEVNSLLSTR